MKFLESLWNLRGYMYILPQSANPVLVINHGAHGCSLRGNTWVCLWRLLHHRTVAEIRQELYQLFLMSVNTIEQDLIHLWWGWMSTLPSYRLSTCSYSFFIVCIYSKWLILNGTHVSWWKYVKCLFCRIFVTNSATGWDLSLIPDWMVVCVLARFPDARVCYLWLWWPLKQEEQW